MEDVTRARQWDNRCERYVELGYCRRCAGQLAWGAKVIPCPECHPCPVHTNDA